MPKTTTFYFVCSCVAIRLISASSRVRAEVASGPSKEHSELRTSEDKQFIRNSHDKH